MLSERQRKAPPFHSETIASRNPNARMQIVATSPRKKKAHAIWRSYPMTKDPHPIFALLLFPSIRQMISKEKSF